MELANASLLDESTAAAESMLMFYHMRTRGQVKSNVNKFFVSESIFLQTKDVLFARAEPLEIEIITGYPYEFDNPIAGKTGTTQNHSDGWFMGMVPNLVTGVWVGGEDRATHFKTITYGQGASMALPIWANYMKGCYENEDLEISKEEFEKPEQLTIITECENMTSNDDGNVLEQQEISPDIDF